MRLLGGGKATGGNNLPALQATNAGAPAAIGADGQPMAALSGGTMTAAAALPSPRAGNLDEMIDIARIEGQVKASSIKKIGEIVDNHPEEAVAIMRSWLFQGA
jgi:flagellar M-ring protein FliF